MMIHFQDTCITLTTMMSTSRLHAVTFSTVHKMSTNLRTITVRCFLCIIPSSFFRYFLWIKTKEETDNRIHNESWFCKRCLHSTPHNHENKEYHNQHQNQSFRWKLVYRINHTIECTEGYISNLNVTLNSTQQS